MNVLVVTRDFPPRINGGLSTAVGAEVDGLLAAGIHCTVVSFDAWRPCCGTPGKSICPQIFDVANRHLRVIRVSSPDEIERATSIAIESIPDIVHLHQSMLLDFATKVAADSIPVVKTLHLMHRHMNRQRRIDETASSIAQDRAIDRCDALIVLSNAQREVLFSDYPQSVPRTVLVSPCVPDTTLAAASGWPRPPGVAINAGRFGDVKATDALFGIALGLVERSASFKVIVAGGLPDSPPSERRYMRKFVATATGRETSRIEFVGWLPPDELGIQMSRASVYICPSRFETFGLAPAEAMLHRTPVVGFRCGGLQDFVSDGLNGVLVEPGDTKGLVDAATTLMFDPATCEQLGAAARNRILKEFGVSSHTVTLTELYRSVIDNRIGRT